MSKIKKVLKYLCVTSFFLQIEGFAFAQSTEGAYLPLPGATRVGAAPLPPPSYGDDVGAATGARTTMPPAFGSAHRFPKSMFNTTNIAGKMVYLNGENITSIRAQELQNVNVRIDEQGNIYLTAPQYEVSSQQSYHPLLPKELPKYQKEQSFEQAKLPQGVYSKQTGKAAAMQDPPAPESGKEKVSAEQPVMPPMNEAPPAPDTAKASDAVAPKTN